MHLYIALLFSTSFIPPPTTFTHPPQTGPISSPSTQLTKKHQNPDTQTKTKTKQ